MKKLLPILLVVTITACSTSQVLTYTVPVQPEQSLQPAPEKLLVLNTFDAAVYKNNNKRDLLMSLGDTLLAQITLEINLTAGIEVQPLFGLTPVYTTADEGTIFKLMETHGASHAIVIKELDIYFDQTGVDVTKTESGKNREAFYDICSHIKYELYNQNQRLETSPVFLRRPHSSRQVISGLLAAGPSIAKNKDDFYSMAVENKNRFLRKYFPTTFSRRRAVYTSGAFKPVGYAISQNDYTLALQRSLELTESMNREVRAKAWYNCAVLSERLNQMADARRYLRQSLQQMTLHDAVAMNLDF